MKKVLVFGAFDILHDGHLAFFESARAYGDHLTVALALDEAITRLKGRAPHHSYDIRAQNLLRSGKVDEVVPGDEREGEYAVVQRVLPQVVAFGYDQHALQKDYLSFKEKTGYPSSEVTVPPVNEHIWKSHILRQKIEDDV